MVSKFKNISRWRAHVFKMDGNLRRPKATKKRKTIRECPNPLFLKWLERWRDETKAKDSKMQYVYNKVHGVNVVFIL